MTPSRRLGLWTRVLPIAIAAAVAVAAWAGGAFARPASPLGTGVVVIETNLAYQGEQAAGTGMVLTSSGEVVTNNHVISGATTIRVVIPGTQRTFPARVVGYDKTADVAVLQLRGASNLKTVTLGSSAGLAIGQDVSALGNAGGTGTLTTAPGQVTGLGRSITASDDQGLSERLSGLIETNAGVQPGDSGGPLLDANGRVIGMDTAASAGFTFEGPAASDAYAIPIARVTSLAARIEAGKASAAIHVGPTAFLGVEVSAVESFSAFGDVSSAGAQIQGVVRNGPAARAGLAVGDVIVAAGGRTVSSPSAVTAFVLSKKPGAAVQISYVDPYGTRRSTTVTLGSGPPQ